MFIATTHSPKEDITKEEAIEDFKHLLARSCEYMKELEHAGKIKSGYYMKLYEKVIKDARSIIEESWSE